MTHNGTHFVLVHGAGHGAWCWNVLTTLLRLAGYIVSAIDLNGAGINPVQIADIHSLADYIEPLIHFMDALPQHDRVVLVGHSAGGNAISVAMERFPRKIAAAVFLDAVMPGPNLSILDVNTEVSQVHGPGFYMDSRVTYNKSRRETIILFGPKFLRKTLYPVSPPEDYTLATFLVRPYPEFNDERTRKELTLTTKNYGSVPRVFIEGSEDKAITLEIVKFQIERNPPDELKVIEGADHMVMYSKPRKLCSLLVKIAKKYQ